MDSARSRAAASALGSVRAERLEPDALTRQILELWLRGISDERLALIRRRLAAQQPVHDLLPVGSLP